MHPPKGRYFIHFGALNGQCAPRTVRAHVLCPRFGHYFIRGSPYIRCKQLRNNGPHHGLAKLQTLCCHCLCRLKTLPHGPHRPDCTIQRSTCGLSRHVQRVRFLSGGGVSALRRLRARQRALRARVKRLLAGHGRLPGASRMRSRRRSNGATLGRLHRRRQLYRGVTRRSLRIRRRLARTHHSHTRRRRHRRRRRHSHHPGVSLALWS